MTVAVAHRDTCRLCDSSDVKLAVSLKPVPLAEKYTDQPEEAKKAEKYPIDLYMCHDCAHVQILDVIDSEDLWSGYTYHSGQTRGIVDHFKDVYDSVTKRFQPAAGTLVIDVGSNDGTLLRYFKDAGHKVHGIDPAREIAAKATASGIETTPALFTSKVAKEIADKHGTASVITAFNVYAHADNLGDMTDGIRTLLAEDGVFVFEVQYLMDIVDKVLLGTIFHEHMSHHSLKPMMRFLEAHDMELIDVERVSIQKGSIIGVAQRKGGPRKVTQAVIDLLKLEEERKLDKPEVMEQFNQRLEKNREYARELISSWKEKGYTIAGYGAARSGPTLLAQFGFEDEIKFIFDDHPQKVGKYSPGNGVPVLPTSELLTKKPDVVIILAWIHARAIIEKSQDFIDAGGKFVVCTPDVRIIDKDHPFN